MSEPNSSAPALPAGTFLGLGIDVVDIARLEAALRRRQRMAARLFSAEELAYTSTLANPGPSLAGRFAVKEAAMKTLGVGIGAVDWTDFSVSRRPGGAPDLVVRGRAAALAASRGIRAWHVSISHTDTTAAATVVAVA